MSTPSFIHQYHPLSESRRGMTRDERRHPSSTPLLGSVLYVGDDVSTPFAPTLVTAGLVYANYMQMMGAGSGWQPCASLSWQRRIDCWWMGRVARCPAKNNAGFILYLHSLAMLVVLCRTGSEVIVYVMRGVRVCGGLNAFREVLSRLSRKEKSPCDA